MERREFLKLSSASLAYMALPFKSAIAKPFIKKKPNVIMLIADDMNGYGFYKTMPNVKMPNMDKFKMSALTFRRAYCASPVCVPSRAAVFSGFYPHTSGAYLNGSDPWSKGNFDDIDCMVESFKKSGYKTFGRGKLFHNEPKPERRKLMWDNDGWGGGFGPFPDEMHQTKGRFWGIQSFPDEEFPDVKNADACIDFLKQEHEAPFFMVYGVWRPHAPFTCPQRFYDMYSLDDFQTPPPGWQKDDLDDVPKEGKVLSDVTKDTYELCGESNIPMWKKYLHAYCACTTFADWSCGRVLDALEKSKYLDDTIVIFWSDNGFHCGEKNHWGKNTLWELSALTPFAIRVPWFKSNGKECQRTVGTIDLYPTLINLCGLVPPRQKIDGNDITPLLKNYKTKWNKPAITEYGEGLVGIRNERFRYIKYSDNTEELYDHQNDPNEFHNLAANSEYNTYKEELKKFIPKSFAKTLGGKLG